MSSALEILAEFLDNPARAARLASERRAWALGLLCLAASGGSLFLAQAVTRHFLPVASGPGSFAFVCLWSVLGGFLLAASLHLLADSWGLAGSGTGLFVLIGLSELAWTLVLPVALVLKALGLDSWFTAFLLLGLAGALSMRLKARSLRHVYGLTAPRAWSLLLLPYLGVCGVAAAVMAAAVVGAAVSVAQLFS
ncbi:MAG: hypothetical protein HY554_13485 [Elusimicrobia bacterium]|nr:hypothetical protein [Elusimicrobiota bacterium]